MRMHLAAAAFAVAALSIWDAIIASAADSERPLSSREVFDISLERTSGVLLTAHGRTVVETHAGCGVTHTLQRSLLDVTYKDGQPIRTDFVIETWERDDGRALRFRVRNAQSGYPPQVHAGIAALAANARGRVTFTSKDKSFDLPAGTLFPGAFSRGMLKAAAQGRDLENHPVFQGGGQSALVIAAAKIGRRQERPHETAKDQAHLLRREAWPILISYFPQSGALPSSEVAMRLYANGFLGSLSVAYPQFMLRAKLVRVERLPSSC